MWIALKLIQLLTCFQFISIRNKNATFVYDGKLVYATSTKETFLQVKVIPGLHERRWHISHPFHLGVYIH